MSDESAYEDVHACREECETAEEECAVAEEEYNEACEREAEVRAAVERIEQLQVLLEQYRQEMEERGAALRAIDEAVEKAQEELNRAYAALDAYLNEKPGAREAYDWLNYQPSANKVVTPDMLNKRFNMSADARMEIARFMRDSDADFCRIVNNLADKLHSAKNPVECGQAMKSIAVSLTGRFAEELSSRALGAYGDVNTQAVKWFDNGKYTKVDLVVSNLKVPVVVGRRIGANCKGSMAVEIKCGKKEYLKQQKEHLVFQAGGHREYDTSFTLCSRDIHDMSTDAEDKLRAEVREAGSPMIAMLPRKEDMDDTCVRLVVEQMQRRYGK